MSSPTIGGIGPSSADGVWDDESMGALRRSQGANGAREAGLVDPETLLALDAKSTGLAAATPGAAGAPAAAADELKTPTFDPSQLPTMDESQFLPGFEDEHLRARWWELFQQAEGQAKTFADDPTRWIPIREAVAGNGNVWDASGRIVLKPRGDAPGAMFHEIFHTVFHKSPLHAGKDGRWGEAFCDAFRYMMEKQLLPPPPSPWVVKMDRRTESTYEEVMARTKNPRVEQSYGYPASLIIKKVGGDFEKLRKLWLELEREHAEKGDVLNDYFHYDIQKGQPI